MNIEPLEARIAPAFLLFQLTDVDGDLVTITSSKEVVGGSTSLEMGAASGFGGPMVELDLSNAPSLAGANITLTATPQKIGGVLRGDGHADLGYLDATGISLGAVTIDGDLVLIEAGTGVAGSVAIKSLSVLSLGVRGFDTGATAFGSFLDGSLGSLKVAGSIHGAGIIVVGGSIGSVTIGGSIFGDRSSSSGVSGVIEASGDIGPVAVRGDLVGGVAFDTGRIEAGGKLGAVTIGGSVRGGAGSDSGQIVSGGEMGKVKIGGDLRGAPSGASGDRVGSIIAGGKLAGVSLGGSLLQGVSSSGSEPSARITAGGDTGAITIAGSMLATGAGLEFGADIRINGKLASVTVGGSIVGQQKSSGAIVAGTIGAVTVHGDLQGGAGENSGRIFADGSIGKVAILGSLIGGTAAAGDGVIHADDGALGSVTIGVDVRDGGAILGERLPSVTIKGSVLSGSIIADQDIGSVVVKGSLIGTAGDLVKIYARGLAGDPVEKNLAIKSLTVAGSVEDTWIFAGVLPNGTAASGNAQIGAVKVGGAWIASSLVAGITSVDGVIADGDDAIIAGGTKSKIGSIVISGPILGRVGTTETFGFAAREIGAFKSGGIALALTKGAANDRFNQDGTSNAKAVGPSLSPSDFFKPDAFAVHVYEVV